MHKIEPTVFKKIGRRRDIQLSMWIQRHEIQYVFKDT